MTDNLKNPMPGASSSSVRPWRLAAYGAVIVLAVAGVYIATRGGGTDPAMAEGHNHAAMAAGSDSLKPVMLSAEDQRRIGVTFAPAALGVLKREVRAVGQVTFDETRLQAIAPKIDGWVEQLFVNETGQAVAAGAPLLTIYSPMVVSAQEELLLARRLVRDVSTASGDAQRNAVDLLASARRRLAYWDIPAADIAAIEETGQVRKTVTLRSPFTGHVLEKNVVAGQRIMAGDPLYRVADLRTIWIEGEVFEQDIASVRLGQMVHAEFDALPGTRRMGRISYIYPTLDPQTRTVRVRVVLPNPDLQLKPGMYAIIRIDGTEGARALTIPRTAVLATGTRNVVFVREANGQLTPREVALGGSNDERVVVLRGLKAGEVVVTSATFLVDAESNLGTALGGMGASPAGAEAIDHSAHVMPAAPAAAAKPPAAATPSKESPMAGMKEVDHSAHTAPKKP